MHIKIHPKLSKSKAISLPCVLLGLPGTDMLGLQGHRVTDIAVAAKAADNPQSPLS